MRSGKIIKIKVLPDPHLRKKSSLVKKDSILAKEIKNLLADLEKTMLEKDGIGIAAPQIGKNIRLILVNTKHGVLAMFNPVLEKKSWAKELGEEGCLSVPDVFGKVKRHKKVTCKYYNKEAVTVSLDAEGLLARVIQHEMDHLDGILFIDKASNIKIIEKEK
jgi:peptide deformylase